MKKEERQYFENLIQNVKNGKKYDSSGKFKTCCTFADHVVLKGYHSQKFNPSRQQKTIAKLNKMGFKTPQLVYYSGGNVITSKLITHFRTPYFEVQEKAKGKQLYTYPESNNINMNLHMCKSKDYPSDMFKSMLDKEYGVKYNFENFLEVLKSSPDQIADFIEAFYIGEQLDILFDSHGGNIFYDKDNGFTFIDLPELPKNIDKLLNKKPTFSTYKFHRDALATLFLSSVTPCQRVFNNLMLHKYIESFELVKHQIPESEQKTSYHYFDIFLKNKTNHTFSATDYEQKMFLDVINGKDLNSVLKENIELEREDFAINTIDKDFYLNCLQSFKIGDKTALEYFNDFDTTKVNTEQTEKLQDCDDDFTL